MIFGLIAALGWGLADFFAALSSRRMGSLGTVLVGQTLSGVIVVGIVVVVDEPVAPLAALLLVVAANGIATAVGYTTHYKALELGPVAVVSPIGASYAVVGVSLAVVVLGERPGGPALVGVALTVIGAMLVSTDLPAFLRKTSQPAPGVPWAAASALGFGVAGFFLGLIAQEVGWLLALWGSRMAQLTCYVPLFAVRHREVGRVRRAGLGAFGLAVIAGLADVVGVASFSVGAERGFISIVLAASAVFPLIAVWLSHWILHERLALNQYVGIGVIVGGLLLLGLS